MNELQRIFLRPSISNDVDILHNRLAVDCDSVIKDHDSCLLDMLLSPPLKPYPKEWKALVLDALDSKQPKLPDASSFKLFSLSEIAGLGSVYQFIVECRDYGWYDTLLNSSPKRDALSELSALSDKSSVLLGIKYFWLYCGHPIDEYYGILPHTRPIKDLMRLLWGTDFTSTLKATAFQQRLAKDLDRSPFWVNSALWVMSHKL